MVSIMVKKNCVAMLLAGGQGSRLGVMTKKVAKPAIPFGSKYRIIDFTLSNCLNSGIDTVGVLTQYQPLVLNSYLGIGSAWDLDRKNGGVVLLPPYTDSIGSDWYQGTANAIYQNLHFIKNYDPEYVLILSGDHIYKMDYSLMIKEHKKRGAHLTISVIQVPWEEASRFGLMIADERGRIIRFEEKPEKPKSNLASMGIYVFNRGILSHYLEENERDETTGNDFGKDVIPRMLRAGLHIYAYQFQGYWKDVGTVSTYWETNMELLEEKPQLDLFDQSWRIYSRSTDRPPHFIAQEAKVKHSLINQGCYIFGEVDHSVLFAGVKIGKKSIVRDSIIMADVIIGDGVDIYKAIIGERTVIGDNCKIGSPEGSTPSSIIVIGDDTTIQKGSSIKNDGAIG